MPGTKAVAKTENSPVDKFTFNDDQIDLIKKQIAVGATDDELKLFLYQSQRTGLDPLARQIYAIKRQGKMTIQTSIDGFRVVAERSGSYAGQDEPKFTLRQGALADAAPLACTVTVYRFSKDGVRYPAGVGVAYWAEYADSSGFMWKKMPHTMLAKCAEAQALRKAFPQDLSGLYTTDEMQQADSPATDVRENRTTELPDKAADPDPDWIKDGDKKPAVDGEVVDDKPLTAKEMGEKKEAQVSLPVTGNTEPLPWEGGTGQELEYNAKGEQLATPQHRRLYFALSADIGLDGETAKNLAKDKYKLESFVDITKDQLKVVCDEIEASIEEAKTRGITTKPTTQAPAPTTPVEEPLATSKQRIEISSLMHKDLLAKDFGGIFKLTAKQAAEMIESANAKRV